MRRQSHAEEVLMRRVVLISLLTTLLGAAAGPPAASAATVSLERGVLSYRAQQGERDRPSVRLRHSSGQPAIEVVERRVSGEPSRSRIVAGPGCAVVPDADGKDDPSIAGVDDPVVRCALATAAARPRLSVALGDGSDDGSFDGRLAGRIGGGPGDDSLSGSGRLDGGPGKDTLRGAGLLDGGTGSDHLTLTRGRLGEARGGLGDDELHLGDDAKAGGVLEGGAGDDRLWGGQGRDVLRGGPGDDYLTDDGGERGNVYHLGSGRDKVEGDDGPDKILARDGEHDDLTCYGGRDTVVLDALDFYENDEDLGGRCERVRRRGLARAFPLEAVAYLTADYEAYIGTRGPNELEVSMACPYDAPRTCAETVIVSDRRGIVSQEEFDEGSRGQIDYSLRVPNRALRRLAKWGRITVVSHDRRGRRHTQSIAGPNVVTINDPTECPYSKC